MFIQENISLKDYNTLQVQAKAKFFVKIKSEEDIQELMKSDVWKSNKKIIL